MRRAPARASLPGQKHGVQPLTREELRMSEPKDESRQADALELDAAAVADLEPTEDEQERLQGGNPLPSHAIVCPTNV